MILFLHKFSEKKDISFIIHTDMSDTNDCDCDTIKKVSSVTLPHVWEKVSDNEDLIFKIKMNGVGRNWSKLGHTLKKGVSLPYFPVIEGLVINLEF